MPYLHPTEWIDKGLSIVGRRTGVIALLFVGTVLLSVVIFISPSHPKSVYRFDNNGKTATASGIVLNFTSDRLYSIQPNVCSQNGRHPHLVLFIPSRPGNTEDRAAIRETWGMHARLCNVRIVFGFGRIDSTETQHEVYVENSVYGDLLQVADVPDAYRSQTKLVLAFLEWGAANCPGARFIGKADEDTWINLHEVMRYLEMPQAAYSITGHFIINGTVFRKPEEKWYLTVEEYPNDTYPPFPLGQLYVFPNDLLPSVLSASQRLSMHWLDDVFIGGQIPALLRIPHLHIATRAQLSEAKNLMKNCTNSGGANAVRFNCDCVGRDWVIIHETPAAAKREIFYDPCMKIYRQYTCSVLSEQ
ncbi:beta-1,3-galactosyltransferase 5-like [Paramacrobiotus metropolitanus]|uniref:beta-1,3-galactosyltransferase 5-like n=1 Tax=Paramacrobiotus metropolitanus TaxID=2943436 RepID=UPI00244610E1|nr:beta-1,3-galactosyltransferase 5-like [Paramacrobiotus metropolitanus]